MNRLRILTLNLWNRKGPWDARLSLIREGIRAWNPDGIGLEEALLENHLTQADEIREGLGSWDLELADRIRAGWPDGPPWNQDFLAWLGRDYDRLAARTASSTRALRAG
ncbi:hypothetical protein WME97_10385 [Sorangium sp. So ce367]|uniref:hypothetical protein n=1 Tax=Sorangium sp. So ce367 TaxID=3133305 RepID=UPI003F64792B